MLMFRPSRLGMAFFCEAAGVRIYLIWHVRDLMEDTRRFSF